jgi:ATP-dependent Clp protease ATP-binding subunit ClpC
VLERFDDRARAAIEGAYRAARELGHRQVGTEHLLLGVLSEVPNSAAGALVACGATLEGCRVKVAEAVASKRPGPPTPELTLTDRANLALERAGRLSLRQRCVRVEANHILLSVLNVEGTAGQVLRGLGVDPDCVRRRLASPTDDRRASPADDRPAPDTPPTGADDPEPIAPRCPHCGSRLDATLAHRALTSRDLDGGLARFLVAYCSVCGCAIAGAPG